MSADVQSTAIASLQEQITKAKELCGEGYDVKVFDNVVQLRYDILFWNRNKRDPKTGSIASVVVQIPYEMTSAIAEESEQLREAWVQLRILHNTIGNLFLKRFNIKLHGHSHEGGDHI